MEGRISLDIYSYIKRTTKLEQYHLDRVLSHFDVQNGEMKVLGSPFLANKV